MASRLVVLLGAMLVPGVSGAQRPTTLPTFALERLNFDTSGLGSLVVGTGRSLEPGVARVSLQGHYEHLPLNFARTWDPGVTSVSLVENKLTGQLTAAVGLLPWLQVGTHLAYIVGQQGQSVLGVNPPEGGGLEAAWVSARAAPWRTRGGGPAGTPIRSCGGCRRGSTRRATRWAARWASCSAHARTSPLSPPVPMTCWATRCVWAPPSPRAARTTPPPGPR